MCIILHGVDAMILFCVKCDGRMAMINSTGCILNTKCKTSDSNKPQYNNTTIFSKKKKPKLAPFPLS